MTEAEWLAGEDPIQLIRFLRGYVSDRKFRLFSCASYRSLWTKVVAPEWHWAVLQASESYADREITKLEFKLIRKRCGLEGPKVSGEAWQVAQSASYECGDGDWERTADGSGNTRMRWKRMEEVRIQCQLIRDIFGNPFRPVAFSAPWRTDTALSLARMMYDSRDFGAMPILADALQDAGCEVEEILNHCRDAEQVHVRGCWVVDLVLGKE